MGIVPLQARLRATVGVRTEIAVLLLGSEDGLDPNLRLVLQILVIKKIGQRKKPVNPVRSPLPGITVAAEPCVSGSDDIRIKFVQMACHSILLQHELLMKPTLRLDGSEREFQIAAFRQRRPVGDVALSTK